ncbi:MAG: hypothetical protein AAB441_01755 [Patescibacteria group bacterium]
MTTIGYERIINKRKKSRISIDLSIEKRRQMEEIDPSMLPPIRDVYEPLIKYETVRFNPKNGRISIFCQRNEQNQIVIDKLDPQKESFWLNFSHLNEAYSTSKKHVLQDKTITIDNTEEIILSTIDNFPQFFEGNLNEEAVKNIINKICSNLIVKGQIIDGDNQEYIRYTLHNHRGIRNEPYSKQEKKSRVGSVVLDVINDLIQKRGKIEHYSPTLANLFVEQQIEGRFLQNLKDDFIKSIGEQLKPHFNELQQLKKNLSELDEKYFGFPIFRCASIKQFTEEIKKTILRINKVIDENSHWNASNAMDEINTLVKNTSLFDFVI